MGKLIKPKKKTTFNIIEGQFDIVTDNNFSYKSIPDNKKIKVYENMQHIIHEEFQIEQNAELILDGDLIVEP